VLVGWWFAIRMLRQKSLWTNPPFRGKPPATEEEIGDLVVWATLGVILGGRIGWDLFYGVLLCSHSPGNGYCHGLPMEFLTNPIRLIAAWDGGMSFHGGAIGVVLAIWLFCRRRGLSFFMIGDPVAWATLGVILGGRIGWDLFYGVLLCSQSAGSAYCHGLPMEFLTNPIRLIAAWDGGMSFHGGAIGVVLAIWLFCRRRGLSFFMIGDLVCLVQPIGQFFGRIANFVNGELWGKPADVPWAMVFPRAPDRLPRHPSQLYEAALEGILLFVVLQICLRVFRMHERPGLISAIFLASYGLLRFVVEFFREPDTQFIGWFSMGQALSVALLVAGFYLAITVLSKPKAA